MSPPGDPGTRRHTRSSSAQPTRSAWPRKTSGPLIAVLNNLTKFPRVADRLQQGLLNELYLGRAMISKAMWAASRATPRSPGRHAGTESVIDTSHLYYNGNSQGGILGGSLTAVAPDFTRATLGVRGDEFSVLLPRSIDFDKFATFLYPAIRTRPSAR